MKPQALTLQGVPETMLWTLHARAAEFHLQPALLRDPQAAGLAERIDCDFNARFGPPNRLFALRAALLDKVVKSWVRRHPYGLVVALGEGLETQSARVDNGTIRWLSVDLPEGIAAREIFLPPGRRFTHLAADVTDDAWLDSIDASRGVFFVVQGLFMYLPPALVESVFCRLATRFPGAEIAFDVVPHWLSHATLRGHRQSAQFVLPPMHWSLDRREIAPTLRRWHPGLRALHFLPYRLPGRMPGFLAAILDHVLPSRGTSPSLVHAVL